jgi:hypothetical protein
MKVRLNLGIEDSIFKVNIYRCNDQLRIVN